jgi:hypothetical protein
MPSEIDAFKKSLEKLIKETPAMSGFLLGNPELPELPGEHNLINVNVERVAKQVRNSLGVEIQSRNTKIIAIASLTSSDPILRIRCRGGNAIGGYVHDALNDCYCMRGVDYCNIGYIPIVIQLTMGTVWSVYMPIPESVMRRYMTRRQKNNLKAFQEHYKEHRISFLQLVD